MTAKLWLSPPTLTRVVSFFFSVNVKWGKEKFDAIELNTEEPPMVFKAQLFALSGVQPDRQKVMVKGGTLKVYTSHLMFSGAWVEYTVQVLLLF